MERGPRFESPIEATRGYGVESDPEAERRDALIASALRNPEASNDLFIASPIDWLKGAIGLVTQRRVSKVSDRELMVRYVEGGKYEWDPELAKRVAAYLKSQGFRWAP